MDVPEEGALLRVYGACPPDNFAKLGILRLILGPTSLFTIFSLLLSICLENFKLTILILIIR